MWFLFYFSFFFRFVFSVEQRMKVTQIFSRNVVCCCCCFMQKTRDTKIEREREREKRKSKERDKQKNIFKILFLYICSLHFFNSFFFLVFFLYVVGNTGAQQEIGEEKGKRESEQTIVIYRRLFQCQFSASYVYYHLLIHIRTLSASSFRRVNSGELCLKTTRTTKQRFSKHINEEACETTLSHYLPMQPYAAQN